MAWVRRSDVDYKGLTLEYLEKLPTLHSGHFDNLKIKEGDVQVWLSRMTVADGMPYDNQVTVEKLVNGVWTTVDEYPAIELNTATKVANVGEELRKAWAALTGIGKEIQSLSDKYKIQLDDLEPFYKMWDDVRLALEWALAHDIGPKEASRKVSISAAEGLSTANPEMQGLTDEDEEKLNEIAFDFYGEGPHDDGDERNESALKVSVKSGEVEFAEWSRMPLPEGEGVESTEEQKSNPFVSQSSSWSLKELFEGENMRGHYSGDEGWTLKELAMMPPEKQQEAITAVGLSAIAYWGGTESFVTKLGE